ncbi:MAG: hypothetical protein AAFQ80_22690 [Cyanobacteria bacterium J06621_8]
MVQELTSYGTAERISKIIQTRKPLLEKVENVQRNLQKLSNNLQIIENKRQELLQLNIDSNSKSKLESISFSPILEKIESELVTIKELKARFSRKTLNIGVLGMARQGKSRLLQTLTGLSNREIPDGGNLHCTGVRSDIHHQEKAITYAKVLFHTEYSFFEEVIKPYYQKLNLGNPPSTIKEFENPIPQLASYEDLAQAEYSHLIEYHKHLNKYKKYLGSSLDKIPQTEIRQYVAQDTVDGERIYYAYLAVKKVDIFCSFPYQDIGQIKLIDMPGIGDTKLGDKERVVATLAKDIDLVLFVRMPKAGGDDWAPDEIKFYSLAKKALNDISIKDWSFMILNRNNDINNQNLCEAFQRSFSSKGIEVNSLITANCKNLDDVRGKILDIVLSHLTQKIEDLDFQYRNACHNRLLKIQQDINTEIIKATAVFGTKINDDLSKRQLERWRSDLWNNLSTELQRLAKSMIKNRNQDDPNLKDAVAKAIEECRSNTGIPKLEDIKDRADGCNSYNKAYAEYLHEVRAHLSKKFIDLDIALKESLEKAKSKVVGILKNQGKLDKIAEGDGSEFLINLIEKIPEDLENLRAGFRPLATFEFQYRGSFQHRIRKHLDVLTPDITQYKFDHVLTKNKSGLLGLINSDKSKAVRFKNDEDRAQAILSNLTQAQEKAVNNCEQELKSFLKEPTQAAFAIIDEFVDLVLRTEKIEQDWRIFLHDFALTIWED